MSSPEELALKYLTPRAIQLDVLDRYIKGTQYEGRPDWMDDASDAPLFDRKPCVIYPIGSSAIGSHISFVLGEGRWPTFTSATSEDDREIDEEWGLSDDESSTLDKFINIVLVKYASLEEVAAEMLGDAMATRSVAVVASVQDGALQADAVRSAWCTPTLDRAGRVQKLEIRYPYIETYYSETKHAYDTRCLLYRREITDTKDTVWKPAEALETGREPTWTVDPTRSSEHGLGFCPVIWYPFMKGCTTADVIDGRAIHELQLQEMDALNVALSQRHRASVTSGDPQIFETGIPEDAPPPAPMGRTSVGITQSARGDVTSEGPGLGSVTTAKPTGRRRAPARKRGAGVVWTYQDPQSKVGYLTIPGDALKSIDDHARDLRGKIAESLNVIFIDPSELKMHAALSGKALSFMFAHQLAFDSRIRTDFANKGLLPLISMLLRIVLAVGRKDPGSLYIPGVKKVLPVLESFERTRAKSDGSTDGGDTVWMPPRLTPVWGPYFAPNEADQLAVVNLTIQTFQAGLCTREMAIEKLASSGVLDIGSAAQVVDSILAEKAKEQQADQAALHDAMHAIGGDQPGPGNDPSGPAVTTAGGNRDAPRPDTASSSPKPASAGAQGAATTAKTSGPQAAAPTQGAQATDPASVSQRGTSQAGIAESVHRLLSEDYPDDAIAWVRAASWEGPTDVPLDQIDFSNVDSWQASKEPDRVQEFQDKIESGGDVKPVVLVNEPNNEKLIIADGHHRALASQKAGVGTVKAYVATVGAVNGPWDSMHDEQQDGTQYSAQKKPA